MILFSDAHCDPEGLTPQLRQLLRETEDETFVSNGDMANLLPQGLERYFASLYLTQLEMALDGRTLYQIAGNHDPYSWSKKLYAAIPNIEVVREMNCPHADFRSGATVYEKRDRKGYHFWGEDGNPVMVTHIEHGHRWSIDWRFLRHAAPGLVDFMTDHFPKPWYAFSKKMGWMPSQVKGETRYHLAVLSTWRGALLYAQNRPLSRVICGHTHKLGAVTALFPHGLDYIMVDGGTLATGSFIRLGAGGGITFESL